MIIILEGPDGGGKTTLAKELCVKYKLDYQHEGPPPLDKTPLEHYGTLLLRHARHNIVFDRFAYGERIYGPIYRGTSRLDWKDWNVLAELMRSVRAFQVLCLPSYETCHESWSSGRDEMIRDEKIFKRVYTEYHHSTFADYTYDYKGKSAYLIHDYLRHL